jgi:hypothetical protein
LCFNFALQVPFSGINVPFFGLKAQFSVDNVPFLGIHVLHLGLQYALFGFELLDADTIKLSYVVFNYYIILIFFLGV